jgi:hypothetical protein
MNKYYYTRISMTTQDHSDSDLQIKAIRELLSYCQDPAQTSALERLITQLTNVQDKSFVTKSQMAKRYGIDRRTFRKIMLNTGCAGALWDKNQIYVYDNVKKFSPAEVEIIYKHLGPPVSNPKTT